VENSALAYLSYAYAMKGDKIKSKELLNKIPEPDRLHCTYQLAFISLALGDTTEALNQLEYAYANHFLSMTAMNVDPNLDPIRNQPRFQALLKKMHFI
jgi:hypothetical protein